MNLRTFFCTALFACRFGYSACCLPNQGHEIQDCQKVLGVYNRAASFDVKNCWKVFLSADFLYWQAREDNLVLGVKNNNPISTSFLVNSRVLNMDFQWHPGLKVGLGMNFPGHDHWDLFFEWTHLVSHNNLQAISSSGATPSSDPGILGDRRSIYPFLLQASAGEAEAEIAKASWRLLYNTVDGNVGRSFYAGKMLTFRPHAGLRGAWFRQNINSSYELIFFEDNVFHITNDTKFDSWGIGPRFGIESNWLLAAGFRIYGDAAFSLLYTYFDVDENLVDNAVGPEFGSITLISIVKDTDRHSQVRPNAEGALGFGWGSYFSHDSWHIDLTAGYEFQYWFNANGNIRFLNNVAQGVHTSGGDLALHGMTFSLRVDF